MSPRHISPADAVALMVAAGASPVVPYPGAHSPWPSRCLTCDAEVKPRLRDVKRGQGVCRRCATQKRAAAFRSPESIAVAKMLAAGAEPLEPYPGSHQPWRSRCLTCGEIVSPRLHAITANKQGPCRTCGFKRGGFRQRQNSLPGALALLEQNKLEPLEEFPGTNRPWLCRCLVCGLETSPRILNLQNGQGGCWRCGLARTARANQLTDEDTRPVMLAAAFDPLEPYPGAVAPWRCRCLGCGRTVTPRYNTIQQDIGGCAACADHGYNTAAPGWVYLVERSDGFRKYGVTNEPATRLNTHRLAGFPRCVELLACADGQLAWDVERAMKHHLEQHGAVPVSPPVGTRFSGWTETFDGSLFPEVTPSALARVLGFDERCHVVSPTAS